MKIYVRIGEWDVGVSLMTLARKKQSAELVIHKACCKGSLKEIFERENQHKIRRHRLTEATGENNCEKVRIGFHFSFQKHHHESSKCIT